MTTDLDIRTSRWRIQLDRLFMLGTPVTRAADLLQLRIPQIVDIAKKSGWTYAQANDQMLPPAGVVVAKQPSKLLRPIAPLKRGEPEDAPLLPVDDCVICTEVDHLLRNGVAASSVPIRLNRTPEGLYRHLREHNSTHRTVFHRNYRGKRASRTPNEEALMVLSAQRKLHVTSKELRTWASMNGFHCPHSTGVPRAVLDAWMQAHPERAAAQLFPKGSATP